MIVRPALPTDIAPTVQLVRGFVEESPAYRDIPFDETKLWNWLLFQSFNQSAFFAVAEDEGVVKGAVIAFLTELPFSYTLQVEERWLMVDPAGRSKGTGAALVKACEAWGKERGATHIDFGVTTGAEVDRTAAFYERNGFYRTGYQYQKEL